MKSRRLIADSLVGQRRASVRSERRSYHPWHCAGTRNFPEQGGRPRHQPEAEVFAPRPTARGNPGCGTIFPSAGAGSTPTTQTRACGIYDPVLHQRGAVN